ncbi:MAG: VWA domain-containing protein [Coxiellaceae bacterium]|nr:VWA domain-containing protein [Coxiellaceae bacterium]
MIQIAYPWIFCVLPLPWLIYRWLPRAEQTQQTALKVPFFLQLKNLQYDTNHAAMPHLTRRVIAFGVIWVLLVFAAVGPQWLGEPLQLPRTGRDLLLAVDLSGSMKTPDMQVAGQRISRLKLVKKVVRQFIAKRKGDRLGLILFGSRAYLQTPLTFDHKTVAEMLDDATIGLAGMQTAIGDAIGLSIKRLMHYPKDSRALILVTDGSNNAGATDPLEAAKIAAQLGIRIYTIGLGAGQVMVNSLFGPQQVNLSRDLDTSLLKKVATITDGKYFRADQEDDLSRIYQIINQLEPIKGDAITLRPIKQLYPYPLALAVLLVCLLALWQMWRRKQDRGAAR